MRGLSLQSTMHIGGVFKQAASFDPFSAMGMMNPSIEPSAISNITGAAKFITSVVESGTSYLYCHANTSLEKVLDGSPYTRASVTADITTTGNLVTGATLYKGRYVYNLNNQTRSNTIPLASASDTQILNGTNNSNATSRPFCVGADGKLYFGDYGYVGLITNVTGTSSNILNHHAIDDGYMVKALINDGRYLVIFADNNPGNAVSGFVPLAGRYSCKVYFWDMVKSSHEQIFEFEDACILSAEIEDGKIYIWGYDNFYVCNVATYPKVLMNFRTGNGISANATITAKPSSPSQTLAARGSVFWGDSAGTRVYAYGSLIPGQPKVFYQPYNGFNGNVTAIHFNGTTMYVASDTPSLSHNAGTTKNSAVISMANLTLPLPHKFSFAKVVLQNRMASGNSVSLQINSQNDNGTISGSETKTFTTDPSKQTLVFDQTADNTSGREVFEEISSFTLTSNVAVERLEIWGVPQEPHSQVI